MKTMLRTPRENLDALRLRLFRSQIYSLYQNIPFYRDFFRKNNLTPDDFRGLDDIKILPIIEKQDIRNNPERFFNEKLNRKTCFKSLTSGSTGEPFLSYFDTRTWIRKRYLSKLRARFACGMGIGEKVAVFDATPCQTLSLLNKRCSVQKFFLRTYYFSIFDNFESVLQRFCEFKPQNAYGPPGYFFQFARMAHQKKQSTPYLKRIFTSSEFLGKSARQFIRNVFQADIFDIYGSTEFKEVAWECERHQGCHINEDEVICEILNGDMPARAGVVGDMVLTDLKNRAMPLIRYRIKDRGRWVGQTCSCGRVFALMEPVVGRASEYIVLPDGRQLSPYLFTTSIEQCKGLLQYQFVQHDKDDLRINVIVDGDVVESVINEIKTIVTGITEGTMNVSVEPTQQIFIEENGKFKVVKNRWIDKRDSDFQTYGPWAP